MDPSQLEQTHNASLKILNEVGVRLEHEDVLARVMAAGASPGGGSSEVRFPPEMVNEYLRLAPGEVVLDSASGGISSRLASEGESLFWTCPVLNYWTGAERREVTSGDLAAVGRLCDHLPNVQGVMGVAMADVPPAFRDFVGVRILAENTRKHIRALCFSGKGMEALAAMKPLLPGAWLSVGFTAHGPLRWTHLALDIFLRSAGLGIPVTVNGEPMAGVSGPVTPAGSIAVGNAEILAGIVVNQILEPGRPVIYNLGLAHAFDMRHATAVTGGPENALFARASAALGRFYGIPSSSWVSTESLFEDQQAGLEKMFGLETHMSSGVNLIWGLGQLESEMTLSLAQLVIDNEMVDYVRRYLRGFDVNDDTLALDVVREVGIGGSYLETEHTLRNFRDHIFHPVLLNRDRRQKTSRPLHEVAAEKAQSILEGDTEARLPQETVRALRGIEARFKGV